MKRILVSATVALAVGAAIPAVATAHTAQASCDNGVLVVTPDYLNFNPQWTITDRVIHVVWSDGFTKDVPMPEECPTPAPVPPVPEVVPPPPAVELPPVVVTPGRPTTCAELLAQYPKAGPVRRAAWGCPATPIRLPGPDKPKRKIVTRYFGCTGFGPDHRARVVKIVTLPSGKVGRVTKFTKVCKIPAVTG